MGADLDSWHDEWDLHLSSGKWADGSRTEYMRAVRQFLAWLADNHPMVTAAEDITKQHINEWLAWLTNRPVRPLAANTRAARLLAVRMWFKYIVGEPDSMLATNPTDGIPIPEPKPKPVPVMSDQELADLIAACKGSRFADYRDTFIIRFLLDTGCRRGEVAALNIDDIDRKNQRVLVSGKTGSRVVPFGAKTTIALGKYLRARARHPATEQPPLLLSSRYTNGDWRYRADSIRDMVARRAQQAGLGHKWPHIFRHTWAHDLKEHGVSTEDLEQLGGWAPGSPSVKVYGRSMAAARAERRARELGRGDRV